MTARIATAWGLFLGALLAAPSASGQCTTIDFDDLAVGTVVTTQYDGVTFSGRDTDGTSGVNPIIYNPNGSTTSEPQCLSAYGDGIDEFSPEFLRLQFDQNQTEVTFNLGVRTGCLASDTVQVRWYSNDSGVYTLRGTNNVPVNGTLTAERVLVFVRVERAAGFRRIEIEAGAGGVCAERFELIDDLTFDLDTTPPTAAITTPAQGACICNSSAIIGSAYDADGPITDWQLHRRALGSASWVSIVSSSTTEVVNGELAIWTTSGGDGWYTLRLRVTNACGLTTEAFTDVYMNKAFNAFELRSPNNGDILGGTVCADGTVWDHCGGDITLERRPAGGGVWSSFDVVNPPWITNDPLGTWNTADGEVDGSYEVRVTGTDDCGNTATATRTVIIDNTPPTAEITSPAMCSSVDGVVQIRGTVDDAHLASWALYFTGGDFDDWQPVPGGSGVAPVINGVLANWDTSGLRACCYTIRLIVTDQAVRDCNGVLHNQMEDLVSVDVNDCPGDIDGDGSVSNGDLQIILDNWARPCQ
jgi:hypothetical protein